MKFNTEQKHKFNTEQRHFSKKRLNNKKKTMKKIKWLSLKRGEAYNGRQDYPIKRRRERHAEEI